MNESSISVRYAKALFQTASEQGIDSEVLKDMNCLEGFFQEIPDFALFIESPVVQVSDKLNFFSKITKDGFQELSRRFLDMITKNKREGFIHGMIRHYTRLYRENKGIIEATLLTPELPSSNTLEQIKNLLKDTYKADVEIKHETNPELIGGFVLRVDDQQLDASIAAQLKKVQRELDNTLIQ